ncbi:MAG: acyl-CoA dehydrogenase family protein, partial [Polyangiales bacterium]
MAKEGLLLLNMLTREAPIDPKSSLHEVWDAYQGAKANGVTAFRAAVQVASTADRLGLAFAVGYPAALEHLVGGVLFPSALCVTEAKGNTPRSTETTLSVEGGDLILRGTKSFVTFGTLANTLVVSARVGQSPDGRPRLAVVRIPAKRDGIVLEELPGIPFVPEVPHAAVRFEEVIVAADEQLPGDGYLDYVKPFRTIEDIHVVAATLGYLLGLARRTRAPSLLIAELGASLVALDRLRAEPPLDPRVHIALHGVYQNLTSLLESEGLQLALAAAPMEER